MDGAYNIKFNTFLSSTTDNPSFGSRFLLSTQQTFREKITQFWIKLCNFNVRQIIRVKQGSSKLEEKDNQIKSDVRVCVCVCVFYLIDLKVMQSDWESF